MDKTIISFFENPKDAHDVIIELGDAGFGAERIGVLTPDRLVGNAIEQDIERGPDFITAEPDLQDAARGLQRPPDDSGETGGIADVIGGMSPVNMPGIGPMIAAGPLAATLSAQDVRESGTPLLSALAEFGVPAEEAIYYSQHLQSGGSLISIEVDDDELGKAAEIFERHGASEIEPEELSPDGAETS